MDIQEEKINLIHWLSKVSDAKVISQIKAIQLANNEPDIYFLSPDEKRAIEKGLQQIKEGKVKSHEQVMSSIKATFPTLF
jgi:hypothetical protein